MDTEITFVVIDDTMSWKDHALLFTLEDLGYFVHFFSEPEQALKYIDDNLEINIIVLLDIQFSSVHNEDGHSLLRKIKDKSELIPVILWSAIDEKEEKFSDFINNKAFGFISKYADIDEALAQINKAIDFFKSNLDNIIEDWIIEKDQDKDTPIFFTSNGLSLSLNDVLREIRNQSEIGKSFSRKLNELTIDLLLRGKERLND